MSERVPCPKCPDGTLVRVNADNVECGTCAYALVRIGPFGWKEHVNPRKLFAGLGALVSGADVGQAMRDA